MEILTAFKKKLFVRNSYHISVQLLFFLVSLVFFFGKMVFIKCFLVNGIWNFANKTSTIDLALSLYKMDGFLVNNKKVMNFVININYSMKLIKMPTLFLIKYTPYLKSCKKTQRIS